MRNFVIVVAGALIACAGAQKRDNRMSGPMIVAMNLCRPDHSQVTTPDPSGKRAICELEEVLGSHFQRCVCREEDQAVPQREESEQFMRNEAQAPQVKRGG